LILHGCRIPALFHLPLHARTLSLWKVVNLHVGARANTLLFDSFTYGRGMIFFSTVSSLIDPWPGSPHHRSLIPVYIFLTNPSSYRLKLFLVFFPLCLLLTLFRSRLGTAFIAFTSLVMFPFTRCLTLFSPQPATPLQFLFYHGTFFF